MNAWTGSTRSSRAPAGPTEDANEWQALVEEHFAVVAPQMAELDPAEHIGAEDDYVRNLGHLPGPLMRFLRAGMLSGEPEHEAAAALRIKTLADHDPALIAAIPEAERARAAAIAEFAELGLKPERAVELGDEKLAIRDKLLRPDNPPTPGPYRPGYVWETGRWRPETPEEARGKFQPLSAEEEDGDGADGAPGDGDEGASGAKGGGAADGEADGDESGRPADAASKNGGDATEEGEQDKTLKQTWPTDDKSDPGFNRFRDNLRAPEGGFADRPKNEDPGGPTNKGISDKLLKLINENHPEWRLPTETKGLNEEQIRGLLRKEFYDRPQIDKVSKIEGLGEEGPQLPEQLFDAGVLHGPETAGKWLQQSLDESLGTDLRQKDPKNGTQVLRRHRRQQNTRSHRTDRQGRQNPGRHRRHGGQANRTYEEPSRVQGQSRMVAKSRVISHRKPEETTLMALRPRQ